MKRMGTPWLSFRSLFSQMPSDASRSVVQASELSMKVSPATPPLVRQVSPKVQTDFLPTWALYRPSRQWTNLFCLTRPISVAETTVGSGGAVAAAAAIRPNESAASTPQSAARARAQEDIESNIGDPSGSGKSVECA